MATRSVGTRSRCASSSVATRIVSMQTSGRSGLRLPAARPGNSTRSTAMPRPVAAWSIATRAGWSRPALAPGVSTSPAGADAITGPSCSNVPDDVTPPARQGRSRCHSGARARLACALARSSLQSLRSGRPDQTARRQRMDGGSRRTQPRRQARTRLSRRGRRVAAHRRGSRCAAGARGGDGGGGPPRDRCGRSGATHPSARRAPGQRTRRASQCTPSSLGRRVAVDRGLSGRSFAPGRRRRLLRLPADRVVSPLRVGGPGQRGRLEAARAAPTGWSSARARRPVVGQRALRRRRPGLAHRPIRPRGPPRGGPRDARALRRRVRSPAPRLLGGPAAEPGLGGTRRARSSCTRCWSTPSFSAAATTRRRSRWPGATPDEPTIAVGRRVSS